MVYVSLTHFLYSFPPDIHHRTVSKVTLDIICATAFSYDANSLNDPDNELAAAYERMISLQSGRNSALLIALVTIPGFTRFMASKFAWRIRHLIEKLPQIRKSLSCELILALNMLNGRARHIGNRDRFDVHYSKDIKKDAGGKNERESCD